MSDDDALSLLLLEDSAFDAELLRASLEIAYPQVRCTWVQDEADFTQALARERFDLILSDYQLPDFNGAEALDHARAVAPLTPFIFVSGVIGEENLVELLKRGATDYVMKGRLTRLPLVIERALREVAQREAQKQAQAQLREADALYARVVDSLQDYAVILLDRDGLIRDWNRAAAGIFGHSLDEVRGQSAEMLFTPEDRVAGALAREMATALAAGSARDDRWLMRQDGSRLRAEGVLTPLYSATGEHNGFSKIVRDGTATYNASLQLRQAKEEAERSNELKDQFLAVLSHELRSPLSAITGWADVLEKRGGGDELLAKAALVIRRNAQLQTRMINDLLDMSAVQAGKLQLQQQVLDLSALMAEALLSHVHAAQGRRIALDCAGGGVLWVSGDAQRLAQVIANLVGNALKFSLDGGRVDVSTRLDGDMVVLCVQDNGRGISPEFLPHVFDRLRQEDSSSTRKAGGLGLGLAIARAIVELHGGRISAHSEGADQGSRFEVRLPVAPPPASRPTSPALPSTEANLPSLAGLRVLLVDDEQDARDVGQAALRELGADVTAAGSAAEALALLAHQRFDVLVSDIGMPEMDGLSLVRRVRAQPATAALPAVALTAFAMLPDRQAGLAAGFQRYVAKPIDMRVLAGAILDALRTPVLPQNNDT
ncbi:response regulator [Roseateles asaccharophilus]|uniref:histidine kinase n=1 Tax=Roseateles asaccharophilus TaxID=582607 RepID=A0ABU2AAN1_9BURK|nr:response regulator [Roseateles asaccharophilus]MDR7334224.1 PAS domain S-box-containing protein [Roseateles asaccharophilus]